MLKYRERGGEGGRREAWGHGGDHAGGNVWRQKYCFYFYAFFFLLILEKNDIT